MGRGRARQSGPIPNLRTMDAISFDPDQRRDSERGRGSLHDRKFALTVIKAVFYKPGTFWRTIFDVPTGL